MRLSFLSLAVFALGVVASPVKEETVTTVDVAEKVGCDDSHFIVSVQRYASLMTPKD